MRYVAKYEQVMNVTHIQHEGRDLCVFTLEAQPCVIDRWLLERFFKPVEQPAPTRSQQVEQKLVAKALAKPPSERENERLHGMRVSQAQNKSAKGAMANKAREVLRDFGPLTTHELGERLYADRTPKQRYDNTIALMRSMRGEVAKVEDNHLTKWMLAAAARGAAV